MHEYASVLLDQHTTATCDTPLSNAVSNTLFSHTQFRQPVWHHCPADHLHASHQSHCRHCSSQEAADRQALSSEPLSGPALAAAAAAASKEGPKDGIVAVKIQYPDALPTMMQVRLGCMSMTGWMATRLYPKSPGPTATVGPCTS